MFPAGPNNDNLPVARAARCGVWGTACCTARHRHAHHHSRKGMTAVMDYDDSLYSPRKGRAAAGDA